MEAKPSEGQGANTDRDKAHMGLHEMSSVREGNQSCLNPFNKRNLFYS